MSKVKQLQQDIIRRAGISFAVVCGFAALYFVASEFEDGEQKAKSEANSALSRDKGKAGNLKGQLTQSSTAEKRFVEIQLAHENSDFSANSEAMKNWLRTAKNQFRLSSDFKLSITPEKVTDKPELNGLAYEVTVRRDMKLDFQAMSDTHVLSFIQDFVHRAPGIVQINSVTIKRKSEMDNPVLGQMLAGQTPYLVDANIIFSWIGVAQKEGKPDAKEAPTK